MGTLVIQETTERAAQLRSALAARVVIAEHLRYLAANSPIPISCEPNAGLTVLTADGAYYPLTPAELADTQARDGAHLLDVCIDYVG